MKWNDDYYNIKKQKRLDELSKIDSKLQALFASGKISKEEYNKRIKKIHREWSKLSEEKETIERIAKKMVK